MLSYPSLCSSLECYKIENIRNTHNVLSHVHCINACRKTDSCLLRDAVTQLDVFSVLAVCAFLCCYRLFVVYIAHAKLQSISWAPNCILFAELECASKASRWLFRRFPISGTSSGFMPSFPLRRPYRHAKPTIVPNRLPKFLVVYLQPHCDLIICVKVEK